MRELAQSEVLAVSGGGFIAQIGGIIGDYIGDMLYGFVPDMVINIPFLGELDIKNYFPNLGGEVGKGIGAQIGGGIEFIGSRIPLVGGLINKILGN
ncbi:hypothetical protein COO59_07920 [Mixta theicola]|uniref:Uncharacterized protein n=1 Tax=Mixta theicola TaxID=1458355 RepID=A0A2K1QBK8_9GAMM|nr:hypothetical protein [Mixta theicola]PNS12414.1 hypothetical protein COO59_07920 [Mixta theicola]GLR08178.1 hypothetical protein GCM10007905_08970 [Mixta theicola]